MVKFRNEPDQPNLGLFKIVIQKSISIRMLHKLMNILHPSKQFALHTHLET